MASSMGCPLQAAPDDWIGHRTALPRRCEYRPWCALVCAPPSFRRSQGITVPSLRSVRCCSPGTYYGNYAVTTYGAHVLFSRSPTAEPSPGVDNSRQPTRCLCSLPSQKLSTQPVLNLRFALESPASRLEALAGRKASCRVQPLSFWSCCSWCSRLPWRKPPTATERPSIR